jgi:hypothetical protein
MKINIRQILDNYFLDRQKELHETRSKLFALENFVLDIYLNKGITHKEENQIKSKFLEISDMLN